jgi:transposase
VFTERIPEVTKPWARKTERLGQRLQKIGLALGGTAGARLCRQIGIVACGSTLLNHLKKLALPEFAVPKILGVDDFAFCKGERYGTILVDLELNQPIALLADWKAETQIGSQHLNLALAIKLADEFLQLLREQRANAFDDWLMKALKSSLKPFVQFDRCVRLRITLLSKPV